MIPIQCGMGPGMQGGPLTCWTMACAHASVLPANRPAMSNQPRQSPLGGTWWGRGIHPSADRRARAARSLIRCAALAAVEGECMSISVPPCSTNPRPVTRPGVGVGGRVPPPLECSPRVQWGLQANRLPAKAQIPERYLCPTWMDHRWPAILEVLFRRSHVRTPFCIEPFRHAPSRCPCPLDPACMIGPIGVKRYACSLPGTLAAREGDGLEPSGHTFPARSGAVTPYARPG